MTNINTDENRIKINDLMEKLREMQSRVNKINSSNDYSARTTQLDINNLSKANNKSELLAKLENIRAKRMRLEKDLNNKKNIQNKNKISNNYKEMEFIAERGYSKASYLQTVRYLDVVKELIIKIKNVPNLKRIVETNLLLKEDLVQILNNFEELASFLDITHEILEDDIDKTDVLIAKERENNLLLQNIEKKINDFSYINETNNNVINSLNENVDILDSINKELSLINDIIDSNSNPNYYENREEYYRDVINSDPFLTASNISSKKYEEN